MAICADKAILSKLNAHILRLCTRFTPSIFKSILMTSLKSIPFGIPSMRTCKVSLMIENVVNRTIIEKRKVQIGSTSLYSG